MALVVCGCLRLGCARHCGIGWWRERVRHPACQTTSNRPWPVCSNSLVERWARLSFVIMEDVLYGSVWGLISRLLAPDDVVKIRTAACRWNVGDKYGLLGDTFFFLLKMNSSRSPGTMIRKVNARDTLLWLRNSILDGIHKFGLHSPQKDALPAPRELRMRGLSSFRSTLHELSGCQTVDTQWYQDKDTWGFSRDGDAYISMSSGSLSPDLGDAWRYGCPRSPDWDSDIDLWGRG